jgi:hypothetical protein
VKRGGFRICRVKVHEHGKHAEIRPVDVRLTPGQLAETEAAVSRSRANRWPTPWVGSSRNKRPPWRPKPHADATAISRQRRVGSAQSGTETVGGSYQLYGDSEKVARVFNCALRDVFKA